MPTQTATLGRIDRDYRIVLPVHLHRMQQRRSLLRQSINCAGARHETFTAFLLRALAREVARCRCEAVKIDQDERDVLEHYSAEELGL